MYQNVAVGFLIIMVPSSLVSLLSALSYSTFEILNIQIIGSKILSDEITINGFSYVLSEIYFLVPRIWMALEWFHSKNLCELQKKCWRAYPDSYHMLSQLLKVRME